MKNISLVICSFTLTMVITGCETVHQGTNQAGNIIGQGAKATGGVTEGITKGYVGSSQDNPYGR